jgi:autophagy-related protein 5
MRRLSSAPGDHVSFRPTVDTSARHTTDRSPLPWHLTLRIGTAPIEKIHSAPGLDSCLTSFMSMLKEADFVRWGSTKRVTNLRKTEQDALWEGVVSHNFETYWSVASKIIPAVPVTSSESVLPAHSSRNPSFSTPGSTNGESGRSALSMQQPNESQTSLLSAAPSEFSVAESSATTHRNGSKDNYRSLPMRFHLVEGAPVVQEPVAPYTEDGRPTTFHSVLSALFPLLFPPTPTFSTSTTQGAPPPLAYAVIQGIRVPFEAEIPWIGAALSTADGWISVCIHLLTEGEKP